MVDVKPFSARFYDVKKVKRLDDVIVPPFDVISDKEKEQFFNKSPYNFSRIIVGNKEDEYRSVALLFQKWQQENILKTDTTRNFYFWEQAFYKGKRWVKRRGIVAGVKLNDFNTGNILPHEKTLEAPIQDRLKIIHACRANLSPIFMMYGDKKNEIEKWILLSCKDPFLAWKDDQGVKSTVWRIEDLHVQKKIIAYFKQKKLYIIDGHHRFATSLRYSQSDEGKKTPEAQYVLSVLVNMYDPAVVIYPIYRLLKPIKNFNAAQYLESLKPYFRVKKRTKITFLRKYHWGVYFHGDKNVYEISIKPKKLPALLRKTPGHRSVKKLDVGLFETWLKPPQFSSEIRYVRGMGERLQEALAEVRSGKYQTLWMVRVPSMNEIKAVADAKQTIPPKSTFFYPKVFSGALIRCF